MVAASPTQQDSGIDHSALQNALQPTVDGDGGKNNDDDVDNDADNDVDNEKDIENENNNDDNTSRTTNTKSLHQSGIVFTKFNSSSNGSNTTSRSRSVDSTNNKSSNKSRSNGNSSCDGNSNPNSNGNRDNNNNNSIRDPSNVSSSHFEINCSPLPASRIGKSYYEETRARRKQQEKELQKEHSPQPPQPSQPKNYRLQPLKTQDEPQNENETETAPPNIIPNHDNAQDPNNCADNSEQDDGDAESYCTLLDSGMSFHHGYNSNTSISNSISNNNTIPTIDPDDDDNTISTSRMGSGSTNMDTNSYTSTKSNLTMSESQTIQNSSLVETISSANTSRSIGSAVSRGEEHITSRMKKYGLFNLHEMKRKQQQRWASRNMTANMAVAASSATATTASATAISNSISTNPPMSQTAISPPIHQPLSVNSGLSETMTVNSGQMSLPGNNVNNSARFQKNLQQNNNSNQSSNNTTAAGVGVPTKIRTAPLHVQLAVEEIHRWLFTEGGHFEDVQTLMTQYSLYVREHFGIPLDRLYYGGVGLHPKLTAYLWKWEAHGEFTHSEMPPHIFARRNEIFSPDEPFCVLEQGRADHVRIRDTDDYIPPDTAKWFRGCNYKDYFALPDIHRGVSKGGLAWSTKSADGFCDDDIQFFRMTHAALTTIMRLHTNDLVLNTLTDRMEAEIEDRTNELAIANAKLEAANEEISKHASKQLEHFACMSHEIRTPLNCIVGLSSLLLENEDLSDNEDLMDTIHMVYNSADLVQGVVNDVLDYAKIESGHFELDIKPSDLQTTLNGVVHSISNKLVDKNVEVRTSYSGLLGREMTTDSRRLQQILYNILGNAAKFSREGTTIDFKVQVILIVSKDNEAESSSPSSEKTKSKKANVAPKPMIRFSIKDYGKGIEEKNFEKIFQPFSQASKETQTVYGGTGLGLSITKNLVSRLGGSISIKSEIDKFTEFIVDLPYEEEQLVDIGHYRKKLSETSIVILDPHVNSNHSKTNKHAGGTELHDLNETFLPFPKIVCQQYGLNVIRCSSWGELESKLGLRANIKQNYLFLAHEDIEERQGILNVEKLVKRERCSWFSFGSDGMGGGGPNRKYHFKTLTGIFPSAILDSLMELAAVQRETMGMGSDTSSFSSLELELKSMGSAGSIAEEFAEESSISPDVGQQSQSQEEKIRVVENEENRRSLSASNTSLSLSSSSETNSKKNFATKYPQRNLKVLIVDDNVINQKVLDRILKRLGVIDISIVDNGKKAVEISEKTRFDCIFMDMEMPVMGGLQACKLIVDRDKELARVTFVTAHDIEDVREKADAVGAFGYISKPLKMKDINEFLTRLENLKKEDKIASRAIPKESNDDGDTILIESKSSNGSCGSNITSVVPKKRVTQPKKQKTKISKQYPQRNIKVLVAEDNLINQKVLDRILKRVGVSDITIVDNGKKAVDASAETRFDCILMDMQMPIMGGLEACKIIMKREQDKHDSPKIIFVTAHALVEFREKALAAGAFDFITKPFKMEDIDNVLKLLDSQTQPSSTNNSHVPGEVISDVSTTGMCTSPTPSEESASNGNNKPTKMPKLVHSISE